MWPLRWQISRNFQPHCCPLINTNTIAHVSSQVLAIVVSRHGPSYFVHSVPIYSTEVLKNVIKIILHLLLHFSAVLSEYTLIHFSYRNSFRLRAEFYFMPVFGGQHMWIRLKSVFSYSWFVDEQRQSSAPRMLFVGEHVIIPVFWLSVW